MNVLIIEDEAQAARRLEKLVREINPDIHVVGLLDSVKSSVSWLGKHASPDLIFMDIQLGDGLSFEIFNRVNIRSPIIFTTAYDEYALQAFKVNSIDYILKPFDKEEIRASFEKYYALTRNELSNLSIIANMEQVVEMLTRKFKERFVVKVGEHLRTIEVKNILYFYSQEKATFCLTADGRKHILDFTMDQLENMIDPQIFFRISRKYLVNSSAITDMTSYTNSRLKLVLKGSLDNDVVVARERLQAFKQWLDR